LEVFQLATKTKPKSQVQEEIKAHINEEGSGYSNWYVGITADPEKRLFQDHDVPREDHWWIYRKTASEDIAREVEEYFIDVLGTAGGGGGGDGNSVYVYAYKRTSITEDKV
jgi:hypothetical protein